MSPFFTQLLTVIPPPIHLPLLDSQHTTHHTVLETRPGSHKRRLSGSDLPLLPEGEPAPGALLLDGAAAYYGDSAASQTDGGEGEQGEQPQRPTGHTVNRVRGGVRRPFFGGDVFGNTVLHTKCACNDVCMQ